MTWARRLKGVFNSDPEDRYLNEYFCKLFSEV